MWTTFGCVPVGGTFYHLGHCAIKLSNGGINTPGKFKWQAESDHPGWEIYNGPRVFFLDANQTS
ncbi:hypothetical protein [Leptolyngbya sp. FACHB-261]|uniref:hypothetical protein n=1 Tax=Leptolyngbya sp. FACHB-261 TaxID=2692806 RepID=UPI001681C5BD|nr:hypothetical protein [Leptolyngbya sp. FACHB-261]MBD2101829.1 hypothetical protein [Leptolyngbya sp. FACHB-261]